MGPRTPDDASPSDFAMEKLLICLRLKLQLLTCRRVDVLCFGSEKFTDMLA